MWPRSVRKRDVPRRAVTRATAIRSPSSIAGPTWCDLLLIDSTPVEWTRSRETVGSGVAGPRALAGSTDGSSGSAVCDALTCSQDGTILTAWD